MNKWLYSYFIVQLCEIILPKTIILNYFKQLKCNFGFLYIFHSWFTAMKNKTDIREESKPLLKHIIEQLSRDFSEM